MTKEATTPIFQNPQLDGSSKFLEGFKETGFLLIHGFTATTVEVSKLAEFCHQRGYTVSTPLLPGHGTSPEDLNTKNYLDWIICVEDAFNQLIKTSEKIIVGGESMGAVLALYLAQKMPRISALLLYSPAVKVEALKYSILLKRIKPIIPKNNNDDTMPWQGYTVYPMKAAAEFLKLQNMVNENLATIKTPAAVFCGQYDKTIDAGACEFIHSRIQSDIKQTFHMKKSGHVMLLDKEINEILDLSWKFLQLNKIL